MNPPESLIVPAAVILDLCFGDPGALPHPVAGVGRLIGALETLLRRWVPNERFGGLLLLLLTVGTTYLLAFTVLKGAYFISPALGFFVAAYISWTCLAARSLHSQSRLVADALARGDLLEARQRLSYIVGRDTKALDEQAIWRATVETVAENSSDGVIAPLLYLLLGGPPLAIAYKAINTLDSMVGYKNDRYRRFGWAAARCDDLVNYLPARLTGILMVLAAPLTGLPPGNAWRIMVRDGRNHASPNSGFPEGAAAGALGVQLGGSSSYAGTVVAKPTIGDPLQPLSQTTYTGVVRLMYGSLLLMVTMVLLWTLSHRSFP